MALVCVEFDPDFLGGDEPKLMPHLIELRLKGVDFEGSLQDYLDCPKLKRLYMERVGFHPPENDTDDSTSRSESTNWSEMPFSSGISFPSIPELECLHILYGTLDDKLAAALQSCPLLQLLSAKSSSVEDFIPPFRNAMADSETFPSLKILCIDDSWRVESSLRREFARQCVSQRPGLFISAN
jgi:hypothetical protein